MQHSFQINVLGEDISFRANAEPDRIEQAKVFVEEQYERLKAHGGQFSRDKLLALLILGIADDLLQSQRQLEEVDDRLQKLLHIIEETACSL